MKAVFFLCLAGLLAGCGKRETTAPTVPSAAEPAAAKPSANADASAPVAEPDLGKTTARLTQALRKFSAETRSVPKSLNELVAAGYLESMPEAPPGKKFVFDDQLRVTVK